MYAFENLFQTFHYTEKIYLKITDPRYDTFPNNQSKKLQKINRETQFNKPQLKPHYLFCIII